ncbi:APC family permease [Chromohalobacter sp. TMW 2.2308]|uniref:APC family permease n=1 Tax=Chromohalobacter TaxID=42054 RepID=UPI001FFCC09C|nr:MULTISPECIES: APC family permease [Chromohalobacter]MCK2043301.1 APC family permease [Chromohalobacter moromii]MCT8515463.1 APC family permease [Chromohalobacter sp. TMW 2.2271]
MSDLKKTLTLSAIVLFGLAYMTPTVVLATFGILADTTQGGVPSAYVAALIAIIFTAISYGHMAAIYPMAGSAYTYVRKAIDTRLGFLAGWAVLLDYLFLPMAIWLIGSAYLHSAFPSIPQSIWVLAFIVATTTVNILGIKTANTINILMMTIQFLVLIAFVALCVHYVWGDATQPLWTFSPFIPTDGLDVSLIMSGAAIACYSFLGFDAITTLAEETRDSRRTIPKAIILTTLIGGAIFIITSYFVQLSHPGASFENTDAAAFEIAQNIGGDIFVSIFMIGMLVGQFASGLASQASASRLLFAMGRDSVLPNKIFGKLGKFQTPVNALILCGTVALLALKLDVSTSTSFINFGAFLAFSLVNLSVIFACYIGKRKQGLKPHLLYLAFPVIGILAMIWLMISLDHLAIMLGSAWLLCGLAWLTWLTRGFSRPTPELNLES